MEVYTADSARSAQARFTRVGEIALQTRALVEEATRLQLLVAEAKASLAAEEMSKRRERIESLRSQSAAMAASQAKTKAR